MKVCLCVCKGERERASERWKKARAEDRFGKQRRTCIGTPPWRDNRNGVVKIERGWGIGRGR